jgi:hypothetical protein
VLQGPAYTELALKASIAPKIISLLAVIALLLSWILDDEQSMGAFRSGRVRAAPTLAKDGHR